MISYIKIHGPPILKALEALEKIAIDLPEVCIWNTYLGGLPVGPSDESISGIMSYFGGENISEERCSTIISQSGESLGEHDFYFEWFKEPSMTELKKFIKKIDDTLTNVGVRYTITTK